MGHVNRTRSTCRPSSEITSQDEPPESSQTEKERTANEEPIGSFETCETPVETTQFGSKA